ncbi:MAG: DUF1134 domain-containing protein [Gammaproteobacteria bacterium]
MTRLLRRFVLVPLCVLLLAPAAPAAESQPESGKTSGQDTYNQQEMLHEANQFFGQGAEGLAKVIEKAFKEKGRPNGYITGEEAGGAIGIGLRYGKGTLHLKDGAHRKIYWQGPSIGFDFGGNASKVFVLVYHLPDVRAIFQRFPGVEGSLYFIAGVGVNYVQSGDIVLAPIRLGVGWRQGASVGYMHVTRKKSWNPF